MISTVISYTRQRFGLVKFIGLAAFLMLYAKGNLKLHAKDISLSLFTLAFLFLMRLYDDLSNRDNDSEKERIYTDPRIEAQLRKFMLAFAILLIAAVYLIAPPVSTQISLFVITNHVLYILLFDKGKFSHFLPLIKYPAIVFIVNRSFYFPALHFTALPAVFIAFVIFEILDDPNFALNRKFLILLLPALVTLLLSAHTGTGLSLVHLVAFLPAVVIPIRHSTIPYIFLLLFLISHLILQNEF